MIELKVHLVLPKALAPIRKTRNAACYDIAIPTGVSIESHHNAIVPLGLRLDIPEGYCVKVYGRSSTFSKFGLIVPESIIDSDYQDQIHGFLYNGNDYRMTLAGGARIFQMQLVKLEDYEVIGANCLNEARVGGLGSTGEM